MKVDYYDREDMEAMNEYEEWEEEDEDHASEEFSAIRSKLQEEANDKFNDIEF